MNLLNGVLDPNTRECYEHHHRDRFLGVLPWDYDPNADCPKTREWLQEAMAGDEALVAVLRAFLRAVVLGRADLQIYLEAFGPGGSGKSTFGQLARALVGAENAFSTQLTLLEAGRFETANLYGKPLCLITEAEAYAGSVNMLKAITGGDAIRYEEKFVPKVGSFVYQGMVYIAGNQLMRTNEYTSGLARRRIIVPFAVVARQKRDLLRFEGTRPVGELAPELPGVLNWVLDMSEADMKTRLKPFGKGTPALERERRQALLATNPIAAWAEDALVYEPGAATQVGDLARDPEKNLMYPYAGWGTQLFPSYATWSEHTHPRRGVPNLVKFSDDLVDLACYQLGYTDVAKKRKAAGRYILNVRLRRTTDNQPRFVTGETLK